MRLLSSLPTYVIVGRLALAFCGAAVAEDLPSHFARALPDGNAIEFLGEMNVGSADDLAEVLASHPDAHLIHLNSPGGEVFEAHRMVRMVASRHMTTVVDKLCGSACTLVFLAGTDRILAPGARLGFHSFWSPGVSQAEMTALTQSDRDFMVAAGVKPSFIDKVFATPNDDAWYPSDEQLKADGVVTRITAKYAITVGNYRSLSDERETLIGEILEAIRKQNPQDYAVLHAEEVQALQHDTSASEASSAGDDLYSRYLNKFMAHASDSMAAKYLQAFIAVASEIGSRNPEACYKSLIGKESLWESGAARYVSSLHRENLEMAMLRMAVDGIHQKRPVPSESETDDGWAMVIEKYVEKHPEDMSTLTKLATPSVDRVAACRVEVAVFNSMLSLPENTLGTLARGVAAEKAHELPGSGESWATRQLLQPGRANGK